MHVVKSLGWQREHFVVEMRRDLRLAVDALSFPDFPPPPHTPRVRKNDHCKLFTTHLRFLESFNLVHSICAIYLLGTQVVCLAIFIFSFLRDVGLWLNRNMNSGFHNFCNIADRMIADRLCVC